MSKSSKLFLFSVSCVLVLFVIVGSLGVKASSKNDGAYRQLNVYTEVLQRIRTDYVEDPAIQSVTDGALHGLLESLDANSSYLSATEYKRYKHLSEHKGDIGAAVSKRFGYAAVISVIPGGPAEKAGVANGDIIEALEGRSTRDMSLAEIHGLLSGEPGSTVTVSVVRPRRATPQKLTITREVVKEPAVSAKMMEGGIGYLQVDDFPKGRAQEVAGKIRELQRQGAKKLLLDLRNSGSGEESEGITTANLFLDHGLIAYVQGQRYPRQDFNAEPNKEVTDLPLVVMVNRSTAGPAEVMAAAILGNARGDVLGDKTFGSGSIQKLLEMKDGSALLLSVAKYFGPDGKAIQDVAVTPNILVPDSSNEDFVSPEDEPQEQGAPEAPKKPQKDEQMQRAIEVLKNLGRKAS
jgi:carboxyl-terminal processing protease